MSGRYEIIKALASADPVTDVDDMGSTLCPLCGAGAGWTSEVEHAESCPWLLARRHVDDQEAAEQKLAIIGPQCRPDLAETSLPVMPRDHPPLVPRDVSTVPHTKKL